MSTPFTPEKQLAFGALVGRLVADVQREHGLSNDELPALMLALAAGQAATSRWGFEAFVRQAAAAFELGVGRVRPGAPNPADVVPGGIYDVKLT